MPKCSFCQKVYEFPKGLTFVLNDGTILHFCSGKCRKNFQLGRKSRKTTWVKKMKRTRAELIKEIKEEAAEKEIAVKEMKEVEEAAEKAEKEAEKKAEGEKKEGAEEKK